jgi:hypothetical protein
MADRVIGTAVLFLLPITAVGYRGISVGLVVAVCFGAAVFPAALRQFAYGRAIAVLAVIALLLTPLLIQFATADGSRGIDPGARDRTILLLVSGLVTFAALAWHRVKFGVHKTALVYGLGSLAQAVIDQSAWQDNAWKFALAWPVAVVFLAVGKRESRPWIFLLLVAVSLYFDFRSFAGLCALGLVLTYWRGGKPRRSGRSLIKPIVVTMALAYLTMQFGTYLALKGELGSSIQARTVAQTLTGRTLLLGARPEWGATAELALAHPMGFSPGVTPNMHDIRVAKTGLAHLNVSLESVYVNDYMLGGRIELHSVLADLWAAFSIPGLALGILIGWSLLRSLGRSLAASALSSLSVFLAVVGLWDLFFSPITSNGMHVVAATALLLLSNDKATGDGEENQEHEARQTLAGTPR